MPVLILLTRFDVMWHFVCSSAHPPNSRRTIEDARSVVLQDLSTGIINTHRNMFASWCSKEKVEGVRFRSESMLVEIVEGKEFYYCDSSWETLPFDTRLHTPYGPNDGLLHWDEYFSDIKVPVIAHELDRIIEENDLIVETSRPPTALRDGEDAQDAEDVPYRPYLLYLPGGSRHNATFAAAALPPHPASASNYDEFAAARGTAGRNYHQEMTERMMRDANMELMIAERRRQELVQLHRQ